MTTYYVAKSGGSNTYAGTSLGAPWRTISYAMANVSDGDVVYVRAGIYYEAFAITADNLTLQNYGSETAIIDGGWSATTNPSFPVSMADAGSIKTEDGSLVSIRADGVTFDGFTLQNSPGRFITVGQSKTTTSPAIPADDNTLQNLTMDTCYSAALIVHSSDGNTLQDSTISRASFKLKINGAPPQAQCIAPVFSSNTTFQRLTLDECYGEAISGYTGNYTTIEDVTIKNNQKVCLYVNWSPNTTINRVLIYWTDSWVQVNDQNRRGIIFGDEKEVTDKRRDNFGKTRNVNISNVLIVNCDTGIEIADSASFRPANMENVTISNCNILVRSGSSVNRAFLFGRYYTLADTYARTWSNIIIQNNIFGGGYKDAVQTAYRSAFTITNNHFNTTPPTWMNTDATTGDAGMVDEDAAIASTITVGNYYLAAGSQCIDAGTLNTLTQYDYLQAERDATPDIGFHEYDGDPAPSVTLVADFTLSATSVEEGTAVTLTDASTLSSGTIDTWDWDYKLVSAASWTNHSTSSTPANLTINTAGEYQVRLVVTDTEESLTSTVVKALTVTAAGSGDVGTCTGNIIANDDFASGTTSWSYNSGTGSGSFAAGSGYAEVTITTPSGSLQLYQNLLSITEGTQYRLAFKAKASADRSISVFLFDHTTIENLGVQAQAFTLTTDWVVQEYIFTATGTSSNARLQFRPGWPAGTVYLDDVCLAAYTAPSAPAAIITVPNDPAPIAVEQTLDSASSTGSPTAYSWEIDGVEVGTSDTYAWTPASPRPYTISLTVTNAYGSDTSAITVNAYVPAAGGTVAQLLRDTVPGSTGSDGGTDHTDIGTTGGVLVLTSGASTLGTAADDARMGIGGGDGTNGRAVAVHAEHGVGTTNTRSKSDQAMGYLISPTATVAADGDVALTDADTTTVTWNTVESGDLYALLRISATNSAVGDFVPGGADVNVGFQPDIVFVWATRDTADFAATNINGLFISFGFVTTDGQRSIAMRSADAAAATAATAVYSQSYAAMVLSGTAVQDGIALTLTATGFGSTTTGSMAGKAGYWALKLDGLSTEIVDFDTATSTGTQSHSVGILAGAAIALGTLANVIGTAETGPDASAFSIGFWDGTNSRAVAISDEDNAGTTVSKSHAANVLLLVPANDGSNNILATVDDATSSTFDLNYTGIDATARKCSILLIQQAAGSLADIDYLQPGIATGTMAGMP